LWSAGHLAIGDSLGMLDLIATADEARLVGHLGPDLLDREFDRDQALAKLVHEPSRPVADALLDQRNLAGIGTIYASEPLFEHRVSPWAPVGTITPDVLGQVVDRTSVDGALVPGRARSLTGPPATTPGGRLVARNVPGL